MSHPEYGWMSMDLRTQDCTVSINMAGITLSKTDHGTENVLFRMETIKDALIGRAFARLLPVRTTNAGNKLF